MMQSAETKKILGYVLAQPEKAKPYEMGLLTLWMTIIFIPPFPGVTFLLYGMVLYFMSFFVLDYIRTLNAVYKSLILLPVHIMAAMSILWTPYPMDALNLAIMFIVSALVIIVIASRYTPKQVIRCMLMAGMVGIAFASLYISTASSGGPYGSKNHLGFQMLLASVMCLSYILDKGPPLAFKAVVAAFLAVAALIIFQSNAVTSQVLLAVSVALMIIIRLLFAGSAKLDGARTLILVFGFTVMCVLALLLLNLADNSLVDKALGFLGKDSNLTGRTDLWNAAFDVIDKHPVAGLGLDGFWQYDVGAAQTLNENDAKKFGTNLSFHNVYLEVAVHLGFIGLSLFVATILWTVWKVITTFLDKPSMVTGTYLTIMVIALVSSMTESALWSVFNIVCLLFYASGTLFSVWYKPRRVAAIVAQPA